MKKEKNLIKIAASVFELDEKDTYLVKDWNAGIPGFNGKTLVSKKTKKERNFDSFEWKTLFWEYQREAVAAGNEKPNTLPSFIASY